MFHPSQPSTSRQIHLPICLFFNPRQHTIKLPIIIKIHSSLPILPLLIVLYHTKILLNILKLKYLLHYSLELVQYLPLIRQHFIFM